MAYWVYWGLKQQLQGEGALPVEEVHQEEARIIFKKFCINIEPLQMILQYADQLNKLEYDK